MSDTQWFLLEKATGAIDGLYSKRNSGFANVEDAGKALIQQYPYSSWVLCELHRDKKAAFGETIKFENHHNDKLFNRRLEELYGNAWGKIKPLSKTVNDFNAKYTAFDVLVDYAFGGEREAALAYLKTL